MKSFFFAILLFTQSAFAIEFDCKLELKKTVDFKKYERYPQSMLKFADDTIYFYRQDNKEHAFVKSDGTIITIAGNQMGSDPSFLKNGNLLFSDNQGNLFEIDSNAQIVKTAKLNSQGVVNSILEWDSDLWYFSTGTGKVYKTTPYGIETDLLFDLNATVSNPDDRDSFFRGITNYQNKYLIINPAFDSGVSILDLDGNLLFEEQNLIHNVFQDPLILKNGNLAIVGMLYGDAIVKLIDPNQDFKTDIIKLGTDKNPYFIVQLKDGGFAIGNITLNETHTKYNQLLSFYDKNWNNTENLLTESAGFDMGWYVVELSDGYIVNGVRDHVQLISPEHKVVSDYVLPYDNRDPHSSYNPVDSSPVVLSDGTIVYMGSYSQLYYFKKACTIH